MARQTDLDIEPQKADAAIALTLLGEDLASSVLQYMDEAAVETIAARIGTGADLERAKEVLDRLSKALEASAGSFGGGIGYVRRVLVDAFGGIKGTEITEAILHTSRETFDVLDNADPQSLAEQIADESPQLIAAMLGMMKRGKAVAFLSNLPQDKMSDVLFRYSQLDFVQPVALTELRGVLSDLLSGRDSAQTRRFGGVRQAADLLNAMNADISERTLTCIRAVNSDLAQQIRDNLFIFDDLSKLDDQALQLVLREVDQNALAHALRGAAPAIRERVFSNISQRQGAVLKDDVENGPRITRTEAQAAQRAITVAAVRLAEAGKLSLAGAEDML